ncbi:MAG: alpha-galactosidase, partial [Clostridia bacterium]|nr:alpha-galactosidase [Clostridia bacterium]
MGISVKNNIFKIDTTNTSYIFCVHRLGFLESLYYGKRIKHYFDPKAFTEKNPVMTGVSVAYDRKVPSVCLDTICTEYSAVGKGDYKEPLAIIKNADGTYVNDFKYKSYKILKGNINPEGNAASYGAKETLEIELADEYAGLAMYLYYAIYEDSDVITKAVKLFNKGKTSINIERLLSGQVDLPFDDFSAITFDGAWSRERFVNRRKLAQGIFINDSKMGVSSNRHNPLVVFPREECTQDNGECYAVNLIYSGNHYEAAEISNYGKTRLLAGINPYCFNWTLGAGESFLTPEAVFTYSSEGLNGMSRNMHTFIGEHIVRGVWQKKERPIVINSWEAMFFALKEKDLVELASLSAELGIELFVLDDGWFGKRDNDKTSLGDWFPHKKKFPEGMGKFADKIRATGLEFGLWVEPEMINEKSELYKAHPDWAVKIKGRTPSLGRNQLEIDYANPEVRDYIVEALSKIFTD